MKISQLLYVSEIAKCKSFSKASKKLYVSQPTLSTAVSQLEEELGLTIFYRTPHGAVLTEEGERIFGLIDEILVKIDQLKTVASSQSSYIKTIAAIPAMCNSLTIQLLKEMQSEHPEITVNILELRPSKILSSLCNGLADIAIGSYTKNTQDELMRKAAKNDIYIEPLFNDQFYAFFSRNHPLSRRSCLQISDLDGEKQVVYDDFTVVGDLLPHSNPLANSPTHYVFSDRSSIKQAVAEDLAFAIFPHQMILDDIYSTSGLIHCLPIAGDNVSLTNYLAYPKNKHLSSQESLLIEHIRELAHSFEKRLQAISPQTPLATKDDDCGCLKY